MATLRRGGPMSAAMRPITHISPKSVARLAAIYYAFGGLLTLVVDLAIGMERLKVPVGLFTLFLGLKLDFSYHRALWVPGIVSQVLFSTILYAITGWISGFIGALVYNLIARRLNVRVEGTFDVEPTSPSIQQFSASP